MAKGQVDLRREQEQLLELAVAPLPYFMAQEQTKNPLTTVVIDPEKELNHISPMRITSSVHEI